MIKDRRMMILLGSQLLVGVALTILIVFLVGNKETNDMNYYREVGNRLQAAGVNSAAASAYENYLESGEVDGPTRMKIAFTLGTIYEEERRYEKALYWYYQVDNADAKKRIVALLEKLKKFSAAKFALKQSTSLSSQDPKQGGVIVAKVEGKPIYLHQVEEEIDSLPENIKAKVSDLEGKKRYLQKLVADELLYLKAKKRNYHEDPEMIKQLEQMEKQLLVQKVVEEEINKKITIDASDLQNYFKANEKRFADKKGKTPKFEEVKDQVEFAYRMEKTGRLYQQLIGEILKTEDVKIFADKIK